jgi:hypothetical protein
MAPSKSSNSFHQPNKNDIDVGVFFKGKDYTLLDALSPLAISKKLPKIPSTHQLKNKE